MVGACECLCGGLLGSSDSCASERSWGWLLSRCSPDELPCAFSTVLQQASLERAYTHRSSVTDDQVCVCVFCGVRPVDLYYSLKL